MNPAELIAANLAALPHPDGTPRQLAGYATQLLPEAMQAEIKRASTGIGEAIVHLLELNGYTIVQESELRQPTQTSEAPEVAHVHCNMCDTRLFSLNIVNPDHCLTNGQMFIEGMSQRQAGCPH
jgi:hypothetical protein